MELNFKGIEMQRQNIPTDRAQRVDGKNGVICLVIMFTPRVMVIKISKMAHFFYFLLMPLKYQSQFGRNIQCYYKSTGSILKYKLIFSQMIEPRLFNPFSSKEILLLFCNICEPPVPFMYNWYVQLIICSQKNAKKMANLLQKRF